MAIVRYTAGEESIEELEIMKAEVREAVKHPYVYDPDCPLLTEDQLREFRPANFATEEERLEAMHRLGAVNPFFQDTEIKKESRPKDFVPAG